MNGHDFTLSGTSLIALPSGALWWPEPRILTVSDLHLGKTDRAARHGGSMLPPYEVRDTLARLETDIQRSNPATVICLGDSFDDLAAARNLGDDEQMWIARLQAGRQWIWIEGNHDPGPVGFGGSHLAEYESGPIRFRHIANPNNCAEISGHYHPKATLQARGRSITRPCFLIDERRVILPAFGTYTGGLRSKTPILSNLMLPDARAILTGPTAQIIPMPRGGSKPARFRHDRGRHG